VHDTTDVNLDQLAAKIREECAAADMAGRAALDHGISAGKYCLQVRKQIGRGFRGWLQQHGLKKTTVYDFIKLAEHEESVRRSGHSSIAAALRMLRGKTSKSSSFSESTNKSGTNSSLTKAAWTKATPDERQKFLDDIGADSICGALSFALRAELRRRVAGQQRATTSALSETIAKAIRQALSLQKVTKPKDSPAPGVVSALNAINNKLEAAGLDLNNVTVVIDPIATQKSKAA
jgi:hypothetical protein